MLFLGIVFSSPTILLSSEIPVYNPIIIRSPTSWSQVSPDIPFQILPFSGVLVRYSFFQECLLYGISAILLFCQLLLAIFCYLGRSLQKLLRWCFSFWPFNFTHSFRRMCNIALILQWLEITIFIMVGDLNSFLMVKDPRHWKKGTENMKRAISWRLWCRTNRFLISLFSNSLTFSKKIKRLGSKYIPSFLQYLTDDDLKGFVDVELITDKVSTVWRHRDVTTTGKASDQSDSEVSDEVVADWSAEEFSTDWSDEMMTSDRLVVTSERVRGEGDREQEDGPKASAGQLSGIRRWFGGLVPRRLSATRYRRLNQAWSTTRSLYHIWIDSKSWIYSSSEKGTLFNRLVSVDWIMPEVAESCGLVHTSAYRPLPLYIF